MELTGGVSCLHDACGLVSFGFERWWFGMVWSGITYISKMVWCSYSLVLGLLSPWHATGTNLEPAESMLHGCFFFRWVGSNSAWHFVFTSTGYYQLCAERTNQVIPSFADVCRKIHGNWRSTEAFWAASANKGSGFIYLQHWKISEIVTLPNL